MEYWRFCYCDCVNDAGDNFASPFLRAWTEGSSFFPSPSFKYTFSLATYFSKINCALSFEKKTPSFFTSLSVRRIRYPSWISLFFFENQIMEHSARHLTCQMEMVSWFAESIVDKLLVSAPFLSLF